MAAFIYAIEGYKGPVTKDLLRSWGLAHLFDGMPYHAPGVLVPGGKSKRGVVGTILCDQPRLEPLEAVYRPEEQVWRKVPPPAGGSGLPTIWCGHYQTALPTAADLVRDELVAGETVKLCDGGAWQVPLVRQPQRDAGSGAVSSRCALPVYFDVDDDGQLCDGAVDEKYAWLLEVVTPFWEAWLPACREALERLQRLPATATAEERRLAGGYTVDCPTLTADAVRVLGANYRIGLREAMHLRLWKTGTGPINVLAAACQCELAEFYLKQALAQKKTAAAGPRRGRSKKSSI